MADTQPDLYAAPRASLDDESDYAPVKRSLFKPAGRLGILQYIAHAFLLILVSILLMAGVFFLTNIVAPVNFDDPDFIADPPLTLILVGVAVILPLMWVGTMMLVKRLHDFNLTGWFALLSFIPYIGSLVTLIYMFVPGSKAANKYGARPQIAGWEKVLGIIGVVAMVLMVAAMVFSVAIPYLMNASQVVNGG